jgi:hypothetical protein
MQGLFILHYPSYDPKPWHASLITLAYLAIAVLFNTFCAAGLPMLEAGLVFLHILGVFIFIPVWVLSPKREGGAPLVDFYNPGGWSSDGVATLVGAAPIITTLIGFDCSVHMGMLSSLNLLPILLTCFFQPRRPKTPLATYHTLYSPVMVLMFFLGCLF